MLKGKKILLGVTGSIAAYKAAYLVRLLVKQEAEVRVIMTPAAKDFVSPLTLSTLSKNEALTDMFAENTWSNHVRLGRWADVMVMAPLSCNTLSKMAQGQCDNLLLAVYLSATCPVVIAPAMDEDMWKHPSTQNNLMLLKSYGNKIILPATGELASGLFGPGRMEEPELIVQYLESFFENSNPKDLEGKNVLITAGPTQEAIDPVRYISNHSSGKMGLAIARECRNRGANVTLVLGPVSSKEIPDGVTVIRISSSDEMYDACHRHFASADFAIMAAAVADYKPEKVQETKIKKTDTAPEVKLIKTKDILKSLGEIKREHQTLVGFALETNDEKANALQKLKTKNADFIVLNSLQDGMIFGADSNKITIFTKYGNEIIFDHKPKTEVATDIINTVLKYKSTVTI
ncbi:MAG TPA: bifunctional phosphopantothenoylcysteine decarboxylase/phosphopantothenate--cysteine ligase CoaBC [Niabella sp.]|nr:bifunctional phosphopantothenoylcysteine decarboxylase/phosphopantothenate--cysteine ligase CoaBC [Niabella sp.]